MTELFPSESAPSLRTSDTKFRVSKPSFRNLRDMTSFDRRTNKKNWKARNSKPSFRNTRNTVPSGRRLDKTNRTSPSPREESSDSLDKGTGLPSLSCLSCKLKHDDFVCQSGQRGFKGVTHGKNCLESVFD